MAYVTCSGVLREPKDLTHGQSDAIHTGCDLIDPRRGANELDVVSAILSRCRKLRGLCTDRVETALCLTVFHKRSWLGLSFGHQASAGPQTVRAWIFVTAILVNHGRP